MEYTSFDGCWQPLLGGQGPVGAYVAGLTNDARRHIEDTVRRSYCSGSPNGERSLAATAWAVKGIRSLDYIDEETVFMKLSARNQLKGTIVDVTKGATTSHVRIDIGLSVIVTSSITNEAVAELGLKAGDDVWAIIKASDVLIGK